MHVFLRKGMNMMTQRRQFLMGTATLGAAGLAAVGLAVWGKEPSQVAGGEKAEPKKAGEVSPVEDLMREHGVLKRVLLIYEEGLRRLDAKQEVPLHALGDGARIIRSFIEDYHGKLEEDYLFPRFKKANRLVDLVDVLWEQHRVGRKLTDLILQLTAGKTLDNDDDRHAMYESLRHFVRMFSAHEAREDTVLFPAFRVLVSANEYDSLGEEFEDKEHELFGKNGFEDIVGRVADIEKTLGIYDLAQFTKAPGAP
jgi:hemerythrin-like domain-containing protein